MTFREKLGKKFVVSVEVDAPKDVDFESALSKIECLKGIADVVNIADSPMARVRMSPFAFGHLIMERLGIEPLIHLTCRDRNLIGLQAELLGAHALGEQNILAITGDPPSAGDYPKATGVFDVTSTGLVRMMKRMNMGLDLAGNSLKRGTSFCIGIGVNPFSDDEDGEVRRLAEKAASGADFAVTQPVFDAERFLSFMKKIAFLEIPVLAGMLPIKSLKNALYLANEVPGMVIPSSVIDRFSSCQSSDMQREGIEIARQTLKAIKNEAAGLYLIPMGRYEIISQLLF
ncbi:MAG: methylenetetrahydrofolate reductase [Candidatus Eisenbacteria bacterium]|nr:methylenetetrahydrofolate reductase [Candidatus Eisenbacteria bacterium]